MKTTLTNLILIYKEDSILFLNRRRSTWPGITFPGGHVDDNESILDSCVREAYEETGLTVSNLEFVDFIEWSFENEREISFLYKTNTFTGELKSSFEGEVFFSKLSDIKENDYSDGFKLILEKFKLL